MTTLMFISDGLDPFFSRRKMEKRRSMKEENDGEVFASSQSGHFCFIDIRIKVLFAIFALNRRVNSFVSRQRKGINRRNESTIVIG